MTVPRMKKPPQATEVPSVPYIGFGGHTLAKLPEITGGDTITCPKCSGSHVVEQGKIDGEPTDLLLFYKCGEGTYFAGVNGRCTIGQDADCSGSVDL